MGIGCRIGNLFLFYLPIEIMVKNIMEMILNSQLEIEKAKKKGLDLLSSRLADSSSLYPFRYMTDAAITEIERQIELVKNY